MDRVFEKGVEVYAEFREDNTYYLFKNSAGAQQQFNSGTFKIVGDTIYITQLETYKMTLHQHLLIVEDGIREIAGNSKRIFYFRGDMKKLRDFQQQNNNQQ